MPTLTVSPNPAAPSTVTNITGSGFANLKTRLLLDGVGATTNIFRPTKAGTFNVGITVGSVEKDQTLVAQQQRTGTWSDVATKTITVKKPASVVVTSSIATGNTLTGLVDWTATVTGANVLSVVFSIDGQDKWTETFAPFRYNGDPDGRLDTKTLSNGTHTFAVRANTDLGVFNTSAGAVVSNTVTEPQPGNGLPTGDLPGWKLEFVEDFTTDAAEGEFLTKYGTIFSHYPPTYKDSSKFGTYDPKIVSVQNGILTQKMRYEGGKFLVSSFSPKPVGNRLYGRYAIRFKAEPKTGYKAAWLTWPQSEVWPRDGEIDFPEGDFHRTIEGYMHRQGATSGGDQAAVNTGKTWVDWHTAVIEWMPGRCIFILDGVQVLNTTDKVPNTPMRWQIQSETRIISTPPPTDTVQNTQIDWMAYWSYNP